jgi:hypothetical protein
MLVSNIAQLYLLNLIAEYSSFSTSVRRKGRSIAFLLLVPPKRKAWPFSVYPYQKTMLKMGTYMYLSRLGYTIYHFILRIYIVCTGSIA